MNRIHVSVHQKICAPICANLYVPPRPLSFCKYWSERGDLTPLLLAPEASAHAAMSDNPSPKGDVP